MSNSYLDCGWFEYPPGGQRNDPPGTSGWDIYVVAFEGDPVAAYALCRDDEAARAFATMVEARRGSSTVAALHKWVPVARFRSRALAHCVNSGLAGDGRTCIGFAVAHTEADGSPVSDEVRARRFEEVAGHVARSGLPGVMDRWQTCSEGACYVGAPESVAAIRLALEELPTPGVNVCTRCPGPDGWGLGH